MREQKIKEYLSAIYLLSAYGPVRAAYVAREMKLSRPTVSVAIRKLTEEGYILVDQENLIRLTKPGEQLARASMHETVQRGKNYHELIGQLQTESGEDDAPQAPTAEQAVRRLEKEHSAAIPEAILILSKRYYAVRVVDVAQFLGRNSASVRSKLRQMELRGYVILGEEGVVSLTSAGTGIAELLYAQHAPRREELMARGYSVFDAARETLAGAH